MISQSNVGVGKGRRRSGAALALGLVLMSGALSPARAGSEGVPLFFTPSGDEASDYLARMPGFAAQLRADEVSLWLRRATPSPLLSWSQESKLRLRFLGARSDAAGHAEEPLPTRLHFLRGRSASGWRTGVPTYARVRFPEVYPGVDVVYYGNDRQLEYDFVVAPEADVAQVRFSVEGAQSVGLTSEGDLAIRTGGGEVRQRRPVAYQTGSAGRELVKVTYELDDGPMPTISFRVGEYDHARPLIIDPVVVYAAYLGGSAFDVCRRLTIQSSGRVVVVGETASLNLPVENPLLLTNEITVTNYPPGGGDPIITNMVVTNFTGAVSGGGPGVEVGNVLGTDAMIAGFSADGQVLEFCTYLGGSAIDAAIDVAQDTDGSLLVYGLTQSPDFPVVTNAWVRIALKEVCTTNQVDGSDVVTCTTVQTNTWPIPEGWEPVWKTNVSGEPYWGFYPYDAFLTKLSAAGDEILSSLYQGSEGDEQGMRVAVGDGGRVYTVMLRAQGSGAPSVVCMENDVLAYVKETPFSGVPLTLVPLLNQDLWLVGETRDNVSLQDAVDAGLIPELPFQPENHGATEGYLVQLGADGLLRYASYLGGVGDDSIRGLVANPGGGVTVAGITTSTDFPVESALLSTNSGSQDLFIARLDDTLTNLVFSTYLGGTSEDDLERLVEGPTGDLLLAGWTLSTDFPEAAPLPSTLGETKEGLLASVAADGSALRFATLVGGIGDDEIHDVAVDAESYFWITGSSQGGLEDVYGSVVLTNWWNVTLNTNDVPPAIEKRQPAGLLARLYPGEAALSVARDPGGTLQIRWPTVLPDYLLQSTAFLFGETNEWADVAGPTVAGTNWIYTVTDPISEEYFRLERQVTVQP